MTEIISVGIDVGTTTTHLTFSKLRLANASRVNEPVRMTVVDRQIVYQSPIHLTPILNDVIDAEKVVAIIREEYVQAKIAPASVATGAVIITGETAKKRNAEAIVSALADLAGTFVSASAGPHLESALAARGSGACEESRHGKSICNVDIGGGTTNIAFCEGGRVVHTVWLPLGGRMCAVDEQECDQAAKQIISAARTRRADEVWFTGGVAEIMCRQIQGDSPMQDAFGDAGVLLARCLLRELDDYDEEIAIPESPIRATVIGAGAHSLQLSGSTVYVRDEILPLRNLPIMPLESTVAGESKGPVALMIGDIQPMGYAELKQFAQKLAASFRNSSATPPLTLLMQQDMGAALGQLLRAELPDTDLIVLDGIGVDTGDCIDIGKPMSGGQFVPVVIKEFVFASQFEPEAV